MCGIFGCVGKLERNKAGECIDRIAHRGPDALVVKELDGATLAHARLSILDTSDVANQPMSDISGRYWIIYNGEVYNYLELRLELQKLGYCFKTNGDTEVVLYSYIEWGMEFQKKCNGMWGLAIWDNLKKELFLSRDRFGVKPLYYYRQDDNFYFASEMKAFFPVMNKKEMNYEPILKRGYFKNEATEDCCIKEIKKIKAGYSGYYSKGKLQLYRWWNTLDNILEVPSEYEEQVEYLRELFLDACKIRMRSDVPIGTALSGGVDSSAVIGAMKQVSVGNDVHINADWQHAFVASMPNTTIDETEYAKKAADYIGISIHKVPITAKIDPDEIYKYIYMCEEPYLTSPIPFFQTYGYIRGKGIKVTLDGHGADELFGGYRTPIYAAAKDYRRDKRIMKQLLQTYNDMNFRENRIKMDALLDRVDKRYLERSVDENHDNWKKLSECNRRLYIEVHEQILPTLLRCYDRYSMGNSVEIRMPFLDYRIVCFAFSIPDTSKLRDGYTKMIVRDAMAPFMDKEIMYRKLKIGFNSPLTEWFQTELKEFLLDIIHSKDFFECELIDSQNVRDKVNDFYKNNHEYYNEGEVLWREIIPYLWKKAVIDS